jgi:hypothetical protein
MKDDERLQVQKNQSNDKGRQRQPENPSQQLRDFKSIQNGQAENGEVEGQPNHGQRKSDH